MDARSSQWKRWLVAGCVATALTCATWRSPVAASRGAVPLVVNATNPLNSVTSSQLRRIFLGDESRWPSNQKITILLPPSANEERKFFLHAVLDMTDDDFVRHWISRVFQGEATAGPKTASSPSSMARLVAALPAAIGVLSTTDLPAGTAELKVLRIDGRAPGDDGYRLRR